MKKLLGFLPLLLLLSCSQPATLNLDVPELSKSEIVSFKDMRPASEKEKKIFSLMLTNEAYAIFRTGDVAVNPSYPRLFQHRVYEKLNRSETPLNIELNHLVFYVNPQSQLRKGAIGAGLGGVIGGMIASSGNNTVAMNSSLVDQAQFDSLSGKEHRRAFYTTEENPKKASVIVIYIDSKINDKRVFSKTMVPASIKGSKNVLLDAFDAAVQFHLNQYQESQPVAVVAPS